MTKKNLKLILLFFISLILLEGCLKRDTTKKVVVYTSVDQLYSSKIFKDFEQKTGIQVLAVYDTEAAKAIGLEKRLLAEKAHPRADIFWNSEPIRTVRLANKGLFKPFRSSSVPEYKDKCYFDPKKRWFGLGERMRVIIVNTSLLTLNEYPSSFDALWHRSFKGKIAISSPYVGTAATHFAALHHKMGETKFVDLLHRIKQSDTVLLAGNSVVKDAVGMGKFSLGIVDSDDALAGIREGLPIKILYYDQNDQGDFAIFGTVAMLKGAPHSENAKYFMDYLLTKETERKMIKMGAVQSSVFKGGESPSIKSWTSDPNHLLPDLHQSYKLIKEIL